MIDICFPNDLKSAESALSSKTNKKKKLRERELKSCQFPTWHFKGLWENNVYSDQQLSGKKCQRS